MFIPLLLASYSNDSNNDHNDWSNELYFKLTLSSLEQEEAKKMKDTTDPNSNPLDLNIFDKFLDEVDLRSLASV